jgi:uncharacterized membrane protein YfcA
MVPVLLVVSAALGGALNSVAGGGSFLTFPALVLSGIPPVSANATSCVALWPAGVASAFAYRREVRRVGRALWVLGATSLLGGLLGALLLLRTSDATFTRVVPWLLLFATLIFTFGPRLLARSKGSAPRAAWIGIALQFLIAVYGGYFGGGMGIMMLATYAVMGMADIHEMNSLKTVVGTILNGVAVVAFVMAKAIAWYPALVMAVSASAGGFVGASVARRLSPAQVRRFVIVTAWVMTAYFFWRQFGPHA